MCLTPEASGTVLHQLGGTYYDVDAVPLRPLHSIFGGHPNALTTTLSTFERSHLNLGVVSSPKGHPFLLDLMEAVVRESRGGQHDADFLNASFDFLARMERDVGKPLVVGLNKNVRRPGHDYFLLKEECSLDAKLCGGRLDQKLGLCCVLCDGDCTQTTAAFLQRDPDFPWSFPW